tara:strand:+ start:721 stop:909 length:189 start_codon:yes stop_codon:yes gene_type:complete
MESIVAFVFAFLVLSGVVKEVVVPSANKAVEIATPVVEKAGELVAPVVDKVIGLVKPEEAEE